MENLTADQLYEIIRQGANIKVFGKLYLAKYSIIQNEKFTTLNGEFRISLMENQMFAITQILDKQVKRYFPLYLIKSVLESLNRTDFIEDWIA